MKYRKKILSAPIELYLKDLFQEIAEIKKKLWKGVLWNNSFYLETVGSISEESIKKYIEKQKKGDNLSD